MSVLLIIAILLASGLGWALWRLAEMTPSSTDSESPGVIGIFSLDAAESVYAWVTFADPIEHSSDDPLDLTITIGTTAPTTSGLTVVMTGDFLERGDTSCSRNGVLAEDDVTADELDATIQSSFESYIRSAPWSGVVTSFERDTSMESDKARSILEDRTHLVLVPTRFDGDTTERRYTPTGHEERVHQLNLVRIYCSVLPDALWRQSGDQRLFVLPDLIALSGSRDSGIAPPSLLRLTSYLKFPRSSEFEIGYSSTTPDYSASGIVTYEDTWNSWDFTGGQTMSLASSNYSFVPAGAEEARQWTFLAVGLIASTLFVVVSQLWSLFIDRVSRRRVAAS